METGTGRPLKIAIVGCGNVATHLAKAFDTAPGVELVAILNRSEARASELASELQSSPCVSADFAVLHSLRPDVVLLSLADRAMAEVVGQIGVLDFEPLVIHTSGTLPKEILAPVSPRTGILYPLQTFSREAEVEIAAVPFFNEASGNADLEIIDRLAASISKSVHHADEAHRRILHIAGVFSCNFPNVLLECTQQVLARGGYGLEVVKPLVHAMVDKAFAIGPHAAQTGPAVRRDYEVIKRQQAALDPELGRVYELLTQLILNLHSQE